MRDARDIIRSMGLVAKVNPSLLYTHKMYQGILLRSIDPPRYGTAMKTAPSKIRRMPTIV